VAGGRAGLDRADVDDLEALRVLFEHSAVPQFVADDRGSLLLANPAYAELVGATVDEVLGSMPADVTHPDDLPRLITEGRRLLAGEVEVISLELRVRTADESYRWCLATCASAPTASGVQLVVCQLMDVDDRVRAVADLAASQAEVSRLAAIAETTADLAGVVDGRGWIVWANEAACQAHGIDPESVPVHSTTLYTAESMARFNDEILPALLRGDRWIGELDMYAANGQVISIWQSLAPQLDADGALVSIAALGRDLTDRKRREADLAHQATHDALTGLPNRVLLLDRLEHAVDVVRWSPNDQVALLFIDLDRFKFVNDELGHDAGDTLLRVVAERLAGALRGVDVVARLGGDEFVVLCPGLGLTAAQDVARRLLHAVSDSPVAVGDQKVEVTASVGVTVAGGSEEQHAETLLREADAAMYQAKAHGRNRFEVYSD
jgi:diguanylate cyclase (GGDEF)-like protein/PAS domain S-box-containing protein